MRSGTNVALVNALARELIANGWYDEDYVAAHTLGFERLRDVVAPYTSVVPRTSAACRPATSPARAVRVGVWKW